MPKAYLGAPSPSHGASPWIRHEDYLIYMDAGVVRARNGRTGAVDFSATEIGAVLQSCHDSLTSGGLIKIKYPGATPYPMSTTFNWSQRRISVRGPGRDAYPATYQGIIRVADGADLDAYFNISAVGNVEVRDLAVDCNRGNQTGGASHCFRMTGGGSFFIFDKLFPYDPRGDIFRFEVPAATPFRWIWLTDSWLGVDGGIPIRVLGNATADFREFWIQGNEIHFGSYLAGYPSILFNGYRILYGSIDHNNLRGGGDYLIRVVGSRRILINDNIMVPNLEGVRFEADGVNNPLYNRVDGNIMSQEADPAQYLVNIQAGDYISVLGNTFIGATTPVNVVAGQNLNGEVAHNIRW